MSLAVAALGRALAPAAVCVVWAQSVTECSLPDPVFHSEPQQVGVVSFSLDVVLVQLAAQGPRSPGAQEPFFHLTRTA